MMDDTGSSAKLIALLDSIVVIPDVSHFTSKVEAHEHTYRYNHEKLIKSFAGKSLPLRSILRLLSEIRTGFGYIGSTVCINNDFQVLSLFIEQCTVDELWKFSYPLDKPVEEFNIVDLLRYPLDSHAATVCGLGILAVDQILFRLGNYAKGSVDKNEYFEPLFYYANRLKNFTTSFIPAVIDVVEQHWTDFNPRTKSEVMYLLSSPYNGYLHKFDPTYRILSHLLKSLSAEAYGLSPTDRCITELCAHYDLTPVSSVLSPLFDLLKTIDLKKIAGHGLVRHAGFMFAKMCTFNLVGSDTFTVSHENLPFSYIILMIGNEVNVRVSSEMGTCIIN